MNTEPDEAGQARKPEPQGRETVDRSSAPAGSGHAEPHPAPGAPTPPAEQYREVPPERIECAQCRTLIPPDEAVAAEGLDYILYFCSPECHAAWDQAHRSADAREPRDEQVPEQPGKG
jgi:hypothetical protein